MKVKCRPKRGDRRIVDVGNHTTRFWKLTLPFNTNPRGVLVHRVRMGKTYFHNGKYSHDAVLYWCGNCTTGEGVNLTAKPPEGKLLCSHCERIAVANGEPRASKLVGHHVCIGVLRPFRLCCHNDQN